MGEAVRTCGSHSLRNRNTVGVAPWGAIEGNADLIGRDVGIRAGLVANQLAPSGPL